MELQVRLLADIRTLEEELRIVQDEKAYNDRSNFYLLNRLAELRIIKIQRKVISQSKEIININTKKQSAETKKQIENIKEQLKVEEEKNLEYEQQYQNFANVYLGMDNTFKYEMQKILEEYGTQGIEVPREIVNQTDEYMFNNYALTEEKMKKGKNGDDGGKGLGLGMQRENESDYDM